MIRRMKMQIDLPGAAAWIAIGLLIALFAGSPDIADGIMCSLGLEKICSIAVE